MKTPCPGQTALLIAACSGHAPFVSALLQHPDIDPNISDHRQVSPLVTSILAGQSHVTRVLVQHDNTDVNLVDMEGNTPLMIGWSLPKSIVSKEVQKTVLVKQKPVFQGT